MNNKFNFTISISLLCLILLACNFTDGTKKGSEKPVVRTGNDSDKKSKSEKRDAQTDWSENSEKANNLIKGEFKKLEIWECNFTRMGHVLIPSAPGRDELIELAQKIHNDEWETILFLVDDEAGAGNHIRFMKQMCKGEADKSAFPHDWTDRHVIATILRGNDATWDLYEGSQKRAWLENDFNEKSETKIADLNYQ